MDRLNASTLLNLAERYKQADDHERLLPLH
jgi:hypothetical protein